MEEKSSKGQRRKSEVILPEDVREETGTLDDYPDLLTFCSMLEAIRNITKR
jgi:hypothetical protein